jgi:hypothetical protein
MQLNYGLENRPQQEFQRTLSGTHKFTNINAADTKGKNKLKSVISVYM